jgi:hypothetical protein
MSQVWARDRVKKDISMLFSPMSFLGDPDCLKTQASAFHIHSNLKNVKCEPKASKESTPKGRGLDTPLKGTHEDCHSSQSYSGGME